MKLKYIMQCRLLLLLKYFCACVRALAVIKFQNYSCALDQPTIYDSALLVEGESLHLSCSICENCEPKLSECSTGFSIQNWIKLFKTSSASETLGKVKSTEAFSIRDR